MELLNKCIKTVFFLIISILVILIWFTVGTLMFTALLIRVISLYTIALLNSFVSGTLPPQDYPKAIEDVIQIYINTFWEILKLPSIPWKTNEESKNAGFTAVVSNEIKDMKKNWLITFFIFASYSLSFGGSLAFLIFREDFKKEKIEQIRSQYEAKTGLLKQEKSQYINDFNRLRKENTDYRKQIDNALTNFAEISDIKHNCGKNNPTSSKKHYDTGFKMFFELKKPIILKKVTVYPESKGQIKIQLHSIDGTIVESKTTSLNLEKKANVVDLAFVIDKPGKYYLGYVGDIGLIYDSDDVLYTKYSDDVINFLGRGKTTKDIGKEYYKYFYNWSYSLFITSPFSN